MDLMILVDEFEEEDVQVVPWLAAGCLAMEHEGRGLGLARNKAADEE